VYEFERDELVVLFAYLANEEEGGIAAVYDLPSQVEFCKMEGHDEHTFLPEGHESQTRGRYDDGPLYSRKLHIRGRRLSASCERSWTIFALFLEERAVNHFARRSFPVKTLTMAACTDDGGQSTPCFDTRRK